LEKIVNFSAADDLWGLSGEIAEKSGFWSSGGQGSQRDASETGAVGKVRPYFEINKSRTHSRSILSPQNSFPFSLSILMCVDVACLMTLRVAPIGYNPSAP